MKGLPRSLAHADFNQPAEYVKRIRYPLDGLVVDVSATGAAAGFGTTVVGALPDGNVSILSMVSSIGFSTASTDATTTFNGDFALGTAPTADVTLSGAEVDLQASAALGPATARVVSAIKTHSVTGKAVDNTASDKEINLNVLMDAADITDDTTVSLTLDGYIEMAYVVLGTD